MRSGGRRERFGSDALLSFRDVVQWAPDSRSILVYRWSRRVVELYATTPDAQPTTLATGGSVEPGAYRPPDGDQILFRRQGVGRAGLYVMNVDGTSVEPLIEVEDGANPPGDPLSSARWSRDGSMVAFMNARDSGRSWIEVMNADGTARRRLSGDSGATWAFNLAWSPDGKRIAFERWADTGLSSGAVGMAAAVVDVDDGSIRDVGPADGAGAPTWSPDGAGLVAINVTTGTLVPIDPGDGTWQELSGSADPPLTWQRLAP